MTEETLTDASAREFLLGKVDDAERERIENLFLTDSQARERVLDVEQELIEDYLEESLDSADRERFLSRYAQTAEQRRQLKITKSIKDWAVRGQAPDQAFPPSGWRPLYLRPAFVIPIAAMIVIGIVVLVVWRNSRTEQRHLAIEQELAQLNTPASLHEVTPEISLTLSSIAVRGKPQDELKTNPDTRIVELRLQWTQERYSTYQAEIRVGGNESYTIRNLLLENDGAVRLRLPAHMLHRGQCQIRLSGITPDGAPSPAEEYTFTVGG